ncbi:hypothetical protein XcodCFBP4690_19740 [Xanthomonas codiaei]|uniref:Uncharacterized protein n=1 Tax=Xanthomonas codiaei TaxID=56463 RepID=A0A2S7CB01_9XANT|nr:hypothetical protein XcodCFBP4690_19740 [Xanthomonas codiaei]
MRADDRVWHLQLRCDQYAAIQAWTIAWRVRPHSEGKHVQALSIPAQRHQGRDAIAMGSTCQQLRHAR